MDAPSRRTSPAARRDRPITARAREDLPAPDFPITPRTRPGRISKDIPDRTGRSRSDAMTDSPTTVRRAAGRGSGRGDGAAGISPVSRFRSRRAVHARCATGHLGHADLDRRKRAAQHDGGRDHRPGRHLALQDEPGTDRQHRRLQEQPEGTGEGAEGPGPVARARQPGLGHVLHGDPAIRHGLRHALRADEITRVFGPTRETLRLGVQGAAVAHPACGQDLI